MVFAVALVAVMANLSAIERLYAIANEMRVREAKAARDKMIAAAEGESPSEAPSRLR
jgi:hypothetical protein